MIIGISGKIGSGKDTVGKIIQYLQYRKTFNINKAELSKENFEVFKNSLAYKDQIWHIKKYAGKLKQIVSILTGYSVKDLEKEEVKNTKLGEAWNKVEFYKNSKFDENPTEVIKTMNVRQLLQEVGTEALRNVIHPNIWVNALFVDYKLDNGVVVEPINEENKNKYPIGFAPSKQQYFKKPQYPNWIITDVRFPNELQAVKDRNGITIRVNRYDITGQGKLNPHTSETALDNAKFNYIIDNTGSIEDLIKKVESILINEKII